MSTPKYPDVIYDTVIGEVSIDGLEDSPELDPIPGNGNLVFFSPSLTEANDGNEIDLSAIDLKALNPDPYRIPNPPNRRPFILGPPPLTPGPDFPPSFSSSYTPVLSDSNFALINTKPQVRGILTDLTTSDVITIIY